MLASDAHPAPDAFAERKVLWILLGINALMFLVELCAGWWADSAGLIADAADMFADAAVYGVALYAVGKAAKFKLSAARISGMFQLALALGVLSETGCLILISRHRQRGVHMRASYIFSANDVLANLGVILAAGLVAWSGSPVPDWIIGLLIGAVVLVGSVRILRLR